MAEHMPVMFVRVKKLKGSSIILVAARHNRRELQAEVGASDRIDVTRSGLNQCLAGPHDADGVAALATTRMKAAGVLKTRADAVMGIEVVFSLRPDHAIDDVSYFIDCTGWIGDYFGAEILSADIHRDESAPHCHVLILPLIDGRMVGSDLAGDKVKMTRMTQQFIDDVASKYGLGKASKKMRTMAEIFTSPGKGPRYEKENPRVCPPQKEQTLSCVGFGQKELPELARTSSSGLIDSAWIQSLIDIAVERAVTAAVAGLERHFKAQAQAPPIR